ncbi:phage/plasmid primase, P4 family [Neobacillus sp. NRS-1170]|uniref:DNA primase family protein n=1 Tax=Neobacillus sp. NRS-1170 TaxID=3233898 RepID=UPI003D2A861E
MEKTLAETLKQYNIDKDFEDENLFDYEKHRSLQARSQMDLSDLGNAERLIHVYGADFRYHIERKKWMNWTGKFWDVDSSNLLNMKAVEIVRELKDEINYIDGKAEKEAFSKHIVRSQAAPRIQAMVQLADSVSEGITVTQSMFDKDDYLLNVANGTLDLKKLKLGGVNKMVLGGHDRANYITHYIDIPFNPIAKCPTWDKFLDDIFMGNHEMIRYIQRVIGYALTGSNKEEAMFIFYGPKGRNGKSTLVKVIQRLLNNYAATTDPSTFMKSGKTARHTLAELVGVRFLSTSEVERGEELAVQLIKQITGRDPVEAERKYENPFTYLPTYKIFMLTNNKPGIYERRKAIWERIHLIPFNRYFEDHERDKDLDAKLEAELEGILRWALEGCMEWQSQGLTPPQEVRDAVKQYEKEQDIIGQFILDSCYIEPANEDCWEAPDRLYQDYKSWCAAGGYIPLNLNNFGLEIKERFPFKSKRVNFNGKTQPKKVYIGIRLN